MRAGGARAVPYKTYRARPISIGALIRDYWITSQPEANVRRHSQLICCGGCPMGWIDALKSHLLTLPDLAKFAIIIAALVGIPPLANRIRLPASVGLLFFGAILG